MADELVRRGLPVDFWAYTPEASKHEYPLLAHTPYDGILGRLPVLRHRVFKQKMYRRALRRGAAFISYEMRYYDVAVQVKKARPSIPLILFAPELNLAGDHPHIPWLGVYERWATLPDLTIDVNEQRAQKRRELFNISGDVVVLPNTLPLRYCAPLFGTKKLDDIVGKPVPKDLPVIVYIGGLHSDVHEEDIADALGMLRKPFYFLAFCHGLAERRRRFDGMLEKQIGAGRYHLNKSVPRNDLLAVLGEANIGLIYYPRKQGASFGTIHAAPGKFYEYAAAGLCVVSSGNPTLLPLIEPLGIGSCCETDTASGLAEALDRALDMDFASIRKKTQVLFRERWCFEKVAEPVIEKILACLQHGRRASE